MHGIYVDGGWVDARAAAAMEIKNPATLKTLETVPACGSPDVERAVAAAHAAQPAWCRTPALERAALLREIGARLHLKRDELAASLTLETGKPLCESRDCVDAAAGIFDRFGVCAASGSSADVVAVITPFNFPLLALASSAAPALAAGSTVVCKPPPQNPLTSLAFGCLCETLPKGVINLVTGGTDTAAALALHPLVTAMSFTGSSEVARRLRALAPGKRLDLETGSLDAFIVCADADLERAVPGLAWARLTNAGQTCASGRHIYVERAIAAELTERIHQYVGFLDVDDPSKRATDLGPLISRDAAQRVEDQVGRALREGSKLILGGRRFRPSGLPGYFFQPTILSDVRPGSAPTREEILGPVITMTPVSDLGEALELSSRAASPLHAWIHTGDPEAAASRARARAGGTFFINEPPNPTGGPFGGLRFGRIRAALGGEPVRVQPAEPRVEWAPALAAKSWWFPYVERYRS